LCFRYTRNLVDEGNGKFNLIILCWGEGQSSSIHDHSDAHCFVKILAGQLKETIYDWPSISPSSSCSSSSDPGPSSSSSDPGQPMQEKDILNYTKDQVTYINGKIIPLTVFLSLYLFLPVCQCPFLFFCYQPLSNK